MIYLTNDVSNITNGKLKLNGKKKETIQLEMSKRNEDTSLKRIWRWEIST